MRIYLEIILAILSISHAFGLECKMGLSEEHCTHLHERYQELKQEYEKAGNRMHINPSAYQALHKELARIATVIGQPIPGSTAEKTLEYATMYSSTDLKGGDKLDDDQLYTKVSEPKNMDNSDIGREDNIKYDGRDQNAMIKEAEHSSELRKDSDLSEQGCTDESQAKDDNRYSNSNNKAKKCHDFVPQEKCDELLRQYDIMKELYSNETTKKMLNKDAYNDLHRDLTEAGLSVAEKDSEYSDMKMTCHSSIEKEQCDALMKKYKLMKEMYSDPELKKMLNPDAYNDLHREMEEAGMKVAGSMGEDTDVKKTCDSSVPKEQCDALLKKYNLMKEMYNDADLKKMLNPEAYTELHQEMVEAGLETDDKIQKDIEVEKTCHSSVPKERCDALLKKYKLMKEMYNDADLKKILNPDAYTELHQEMVEAGIETERKSKEDGYTKMTCDSSVPKEQCDALLKKYKLMKEMYNDADLKKMLNPEAYTELHQEMVEAGIKAERKSKEMSCKTKPLSRDIADAMDI